MAAVLMVALAIVLRLRLPRVPVASELSYGAALRSVAVLVRSHPVLRRRMAYGALVFAAFSIFWSAVAFLLAGPDHGWSEGEIGLLGLVGVAGALCAQVSGRLADRGLSRRGTGAWLALTLVSFAVLFLGQHSVAALVAGVVLLDAGVQGAHVLNQSAVYALDGAARSRLTTAYMTLYFVGGAAGSALSAVLYASHGWAGVCTAGAVVAGAALALWATELRGPRTR